MHGVAATGAALGRRPGLDFVNPDRLLLGERALGLDVEDRDPHPPTGERNGELGAELVIPPATTATRPTRSKSGSLTAPILVRRLRPAILDRCFRGL